MGNHISHRNSDTMAKVIFPDGTVHGIDQNLAVAELMLEHPHQVVVELCALMAGNKPTPLPADKKLDMKKVYLMLPMKRGKTAIVSANEARQLLLKAKCVLRSDPLPSLEGIVPYFVRMCPTGTRVRNDVLLQGRTVSVKKPEETIDTMELLLETFDERPEFLSKQFSGKGWKPSLETIKEKGVEKKVPHWLF